MPSPTISQLIGKPAVQEDSGTHKQRSNLHSVNRQLDELIRQVGNEEIAKDLAGVKGKIARLIGSEPPQKLEAGALASLAEITTAIKTGSGLPGWEAEEVSGEDHEKNLSRVLVYYGIQVDPNDAKSYAFNRDADEPGELERIEVIALPGGKIFVSSWATDQATGGGDFFDSVSELEKELIFY